jgi:hypothetical protein
VKQQEDPGVTKFWTGVLVGVVVTTVLDVLTYILFP